MSAHVCHVITSCVGRCISSVCVWVQIYEEYPIVSAALATQTHTCRYYSLHGGIPTASYSQVNCTLIHTLTHHRFGEGIRGQCASAAIYSREPEKWRRFKRAWNNYSLATGLSEKDEPVQVATLLMVSGEEAREVFATFQTGSTEAMTRKVSPF